MLDCDLDSVKKPLQINWYIRVQFSSHLLMKFTTSSIILGSSLIVPRCACDPYRSSRILKVEPTREEHEEEGGCSSRRQNTRLQLPRLLVFNIFLSTPRRLHLSTRQGTKFHNFSCHYLQFWLWFLDRGCSRWLVPESVGKIRLFLSDEQMTTWFYVPRKLRPRLANSSRWPWVRVPEVKAKPCNSWAMWLFCSSLFGVCSWLGAAGAGNPNGVSTVLLLVVWGLSE